MPAATHPPLQERIHTALEASPYISENHIRFEAEEGHVTLNGQVDSYFKKQMAQEAVRRVDGVAAIQNMLQVNWA